MTVPGQVTGKAATDSHEPGPLDMLRHIEAFHAAIAEIREVYPRMELGQLEILLKVALQQGVSAADLLARADGRFTKSGLYKTISALSDDRLPGSVEGRVSGLDLISRIPDPGDGRVTLLVLSRRGRQLMRTIARRVAPAGSAARSRNATPSDCRLFNGSSS